MTKAVGGGVAGSPVSRSDRMLCDTKIFEDSEDLQVNIQGFERLSRSGCLCAVEIQTGADIPSNSCPAVRGPYC